MLTREYQSLEDLRLWHRFHVKLTAAYGIASFVALAAMGWSFYRSGVDAELDGLRTRLLAMAVSLAATMDGDAVARLQTRADAETPEYETLYAAFESIIARFPKITGIYVMGPTESPDTLRVFVDVTPGDPNPSWPGDLYDATDLPVMHLGLSEPAVEEQPFADEYGVTLSGYAPIRTSDGAPLGLVGLDVDAESLTLLRSRMLRTTLLLFGVVSARLEQLNKQVGTTILMSGAVREALGEELASQVEPRGSHLVKGRSEPIETWSI